LNNKLNEGRVKSAVRKKRLFLIFIVVVLIIISILIVYQDDDVKSIIKDKEVHDEIIDEKTKDTTELKQLKKKYKDMIGWIEIPDTEFSYPVMQTGIKKHRESEPEFYLHADVKGEYSFIGTPFLDSRCNLDSDNLIIYGHNIRGGRMFGLLHGYRKTEYYKEQPDDKRFNEGGEA
jgi:sortase B